MTQLEPLQQINARQDAVVYQQKDDEISLIDLFRVLIKRRRTVYTVFTLIVLMGAFAAFSMKKQYQYSATIEIGSGKTGLIELPSTVLAKIQNAYNLIAQTDYHKTHPKDRQTYNINARIPKDSTVIVLDAKGSLGKENTYVQIMNDIIKRVVTDHNQLLDILRKEYQLVIEKKQNAIASLERQFSVLQDQEKRLEDNKRLIAKQIEQTQKAIKDDRLNRAKASQRVKDEARAMTLLMIDNSMQQDQNRLDQLEEKLTISLADQKDNIETSKDNAQRKISEVKMELAKEQFELKNLRATRALVSPLRSITSVSLGKIKILMLIMVVGALVALIAAFLHEFISKARDNFAA